MNQPGERTRLFRALTVLQPYAHLIATPDAELPMGVCQKRVENRKWYCGHRGPLAIHAGKGDKMLRASDERYGKMVFGGVVAIAEMVACLRFPKDELPKEYSWVRDHEHAEGPYLFVLSNVRRLRLPYMCRGFQGLWNVDIPEELLPE